MDNASHHPAAAPAGFPLPPVDAEIVLETARLPVGTDIVPERGTAGGDRLLQHGDDRPRQPGAAPGPQKAGPPARRDAGPEQRLAGVDVADSDHQPLVEKGRLDAAPSAGQQSLETGAVERRREGLDAETGEARMAVEIPLRDQEQEAEAPRIDEPQDRAALAEEGEMLVPAPWRTVEEQPPRHPEMEQQAIRIVEVDEDVFRASREIDHPPSVHLPFQVRRQGRPQPFDTPLQPQDAATAQPRGQGPHGGLDFGKFGHGFLDTSEWRLAGAPPLAYKAWRRSACGTGIGMGNGSRTSRRTAATSAVDELARSFGERPVDPAEKARLVREVFARVAERYDLMNDLMSAGVHRLWKEALIDWLYPRPGIRLLDLAGGTGDVAFRLLERLDGRATITLCDINPDMLGVGRDRAIDRGWLAEIDWIAGDAEALPFPARRFDAVTIAFGIRNVTRIDRALAEIRRVLKPGGRFLCLEFGRVVVPLLDRLYDAYSFSVVPLLGRVVAGDEESYRYLVESIRRFPDQPTFARLIAEAGFANVAWRNLSTGIAAIHSGWRI